MGLFQRIQDVATDASLLLLDANRRFRLALDKINRNIPGPYTANDLTDDVTHTAVNVALFWLKFLRPLRDPALPTLTISAPAGTIPGAKGLSGTVTLDTPVTGTLSGTAGPTPPPPVTVTPLVFLGWSVVPAATDPKTVAPLAMKSPVPDSDMDPLRQEITVFLNVPAAAPMPEQGLYQGFVLVGQAPAAIVVVRAL